MLTPNIFYLQGFNLGSILEESSRARLPDGIATLEKVELTLLMARLAWFTVSGQVRKRGGRPLMWS
jgi:hypothetical protein